MIDFKNSSYLKLKQIDKTKGGELVEMLLTDGEQVISAYKTVRDSVVFTNKRAIAVNIQGATGKKRDFTSLPYSKVSAFSVETSGVFDLDNELQLWFSGMGKVIFEFSGRSDILAIGKLVASHALS